MIVRGVFAAALLALSAQAAVAEMSYNLFVEQSTSKDGAIQFASTSYLLGLITGLEWMDYELGGEKKFCLPHSLVLNAPTARGLMQSMVENHPSIGTSPIGLVLMKTLEADFPCK